MNDGVNIADSYQMINDTYNNILNSMNIVSDTYYKNSKVNEITKKQTFNIMNDIDIYNTNNISNSISHNNYLNSIINSYYNTNIINDIIDDFYNKILNLIHINTDYKTINVSLTKEIKELILNNFDLINNDRDLEFEMNNILIALTNILNQKNNLKKNKTTIDLGKCENRLLEFYNISNNSNLYIFKIEVKEEGMKIPKIEYEVYYPFNNNILTKLNLTNCKNMKIDISIPVKINDDIDKHNQNSNYYNDLCTKATSEAGTDISLNDRKKEFINKNMTLCEEDCDLIEYDNVVEKVKCSCKIKIKLPLIEDIKIDKNKLYRSFTNIKNIANINFMKCYKSVFNSKGLQKNYGFLILIVLLFIYFLCFFLFYFKDYNELKKIIYKISEAKAKIFNMNNKEKNNIDVIIFDEVKNEKKINSNEEKIDNNIYNKKNRRKRKKSKLFKFPPKKKLKKPKIKKEKTEENKKNEVKDISSELNNNIQIDKEYKEILKYNDYELNSLIYEKVKKYDKRTYVQYYISLLKEKHLFIFSFYSNNKDYNSQIIKIFLFFFFVSVNLTVNALFFNDGTMHKIYIDEGKFNFIYQIPQIIYSTLISTIINTLIKYLSLTEKNVIEFKQTENKEDFKLKLNKIFKTLKIKFILFFSFSFIFLVIFMYYITCFCGIYVNTQIQLIKDTSISFGLSLIYPFFINLIPCILRMSAIKVKDRDRNCLFKFSQLMQSI